MSTVVYKWDWSNFKPWPARHVISGPDGRTDYTWGPLTVTFNGPIGTTFCPYKVGDGVVHKKYGQGTVKAIPPVGKYIIYVYFDSYKSAFWVPVHELTKI